MITFLVVTSIINLAAGYALAVYWRAGTWESTPLSTNDAGTIGMYPAMAAAPPSSMTPSAAASTAVMSPRITPPGPPSQEKVAVQPSGISQPGEQGHQPADHRSEVDEDLLAGIEEFRNQLAQLKTKGAEEAPMVLGGV